MAKNIEQVLRDADDLAREYGAAAMSMASDRANFAFDRRDLPRQNHWINVFVVLRDRAKTEGASVAAAEQLETSKSPSA